MPTIATVFLKHRSTALRYTFALVAVVLATAMRFALTPALGDRSPFTLFFPAIILCAWYGGLGPGLFATGAGAIVALYFFFEPYYSFSLSDPTVPAQLILYVFAGALISALAESLHRSKRTAEANERSEREERERFRVTLASIGDAVIATDYEGRVTFMNPVAETLTGWRQDEAQGRPLMEVFRTIDDVTGQPMEIPHPRSIWEDDSGKHALLITRDGTELPIANSAAPIQGPGGETRGAVLVFRDISFSRHLGKERSLLAEIVASSEDAIVSKNLKGIIESWNGAAARMFGYTADEAIGQSITMIIPPDRLEEERVILARINKGERVEHFETVRVARDGRKLDISLTVSPVRDTSGTIVGASKVARDITQRKRDERELSRLFASERAAREQAEGASRAKDEFVAMVSHEIRSPLHAILGWVQLLQTGKLDTAKAARALDNIESNARTQAQLVDDLLDISRVITGKLKLDIRTVEPAQIVQSTLDSIRPAADARAIRLHVTLDSRGNLVSADPDRLQQIVWNLLSNAVKFTAPNGRIEVRLDNSDSQVRLVVKDTGSGIHPDFLPFVFERFSQGRLASGKKHGLGLGLAIVRHLAELHGGTVQAESAGEGQGATFTVQLPITVRASAQAQDTHSDSTETTETAIQLDGLHVLIVDDEADMRELLATVLTQHGAHVTAVATTAEVVDALDRLQPSLLISDIGMPDEDGYSLMRRLRKSGGNGRDIPAIALTGFARPQDRMSALAAGFQMYVSKPVESTELLTVIASLTGRL